MLKKIIFSFQANFIVAILTLIITLITAKFLGSYGKGYLSIIAVYISIIQLVNEVLGASTVFFLLKKYQVNEIFLVSYFWFFLVSFISMLIISFFKLIDVSLIIIIFFNVFFSSVFLLNQRIILNKMNTKWYNFLIVLQPLLILILIYFKGATTFTVKDFLFFQMLSYLISSFLAFLVLLKELRKFNLRYSILEDFVKESMSLGAVNQAANLSQTINYRASYFFIEKFQGLQAVGVFSIVLSFANVIWLFAVTAGTLLGSEISKSDKLNKKEIQQFFNYMKLSLAFTFLAIIIVYFIPTELYIWALNKDFSSLKQLILLMTPAILVFTLAKILGYFFSSLGKMRVNFYSSLAGVIPSVLLGYLLIKEFKIYGAVISCSISFIITSMVLVYYFWKEKSKVKQAI